MSNTRTKRGCFASERREHAKCWRVPNLVAAQPLKGGCCEAFMLIWGVSVRNQHGLDSTFGGDLRKRCRPGKRDITTPHPFREATLISTATTRPNRQHAPSLCINCESMVRT